MSDLFEVVFESITKEQLPVLLNSIIGISKGISNIECTDGEAIKESTDIAASVVYKAVKSESDICVTMRFDLLGINASLGLSNVFLRLIKYDHFYDVDFNFDIGELETSPNTINMLHTYVTTLSKKCGIVSFFAGMEPASDEDTRYFTGAKLGPIKG